MISESVIPLAYFITFTCYGTWLHGGKSTSVDYYNNIPGTEFIPYDRRRLYQVKNLMLETPYSLDELRRHIVLQAICEVCRYRQWVLLAVHVRSNHVHLVIHAQISPEHIMNTVKAYASRYLN